LLLLQLSFRRLYPEPVTLGGVGYAAPIPARGRTVGLDLWVSWRYRGGLLGYGEHCDLL